MQQTLLTEGRGYEPVDVLLGRLYKTSTARAYLAVWPQLVRVDNELAGRSTRI
jgi:hypothetical protein